VTSTSRATGRLALALAAAVLLLSAPGAQATVTITGNYGDDAIVLFQVLDQSNRRLLASTRTGGGAFGPLRAVTPPGFSSAQLVGVDDAGGAVAVWNGAHPSTTGTIVAAVKPPGGRFGPPDRLSEGTGADEPRLAVNGRGDAIALWARYPRALRYSFRPAGGEFSPAADVPGAREDGIAVALDADGGALVLWARRGALRSSYRPPGGSFGAPVAVTGPAREQVVSGTALTAAGRSGDMLLAWQDGGSIEALERRAGSATFEDQPATVADGVPDGTPIRSLVAGPDGRAALAYGTAPVSAVVRGTDRRWSVPEPIPAAASLGALQLALNARGEVAAAWAEPGRAKVAAYRPAGGVFGAPLTLAGRRPLFSPGPIDDRVSLWMDEAGRATATFEISDGERTSAYAREFTEQGARPRALLGRKRTYIREAPRSACIPRRGRVLRRTRRSVIAEDRLHRPYGCLFARGARVGLSSDTGIEPGVALAGPLVGYAYDSCDIESCETSVVVADLRDESNGLNRSVAANARGTGHVPALRMRANGAIAWVTCPSNREPTFIGVGQCRRGTSKRKEVYAWNAHDRRPRRLEVSSRIDPGSLRLRGSRLTWRNGRQLRTARLR
jgi:hypothetical protein